MIKLLYTLSLVSTSSTDVTLFGDMGDNYFMSYIISKDKLTNDDIEVKMDTSISFVHDLAETKVEKMPYNVYLEYKGFDWKKYVQLNSKSDKSEAEEYFNSYMEEYNNLKDVNNKFYFYTLGIGFQDVENIKEDEEHISKISVVSNKRGYDADCNIHLYRKADDASKVGKISMKSAGKWNLPIIPNGEGIISCDFNNIEFTTNDNIEITDIKVLYNDSMKVNTANFDINGVNIEWEAGLEIEKDAEVTLNFNLLDEDFKSQLVSYMNGVICIEYKCDDEVYNELFQVQYSTGLDPYEAYANYIDNKDILTYYVETFEGNEE